MNIYQRVKERSLLLNKILILNRDKHIKAKTNTEIEDEKILMLLANIKSV